MSINADIKDIIVYVINSDDDLDSIKKQINIALDVMYVTRDSYDMEKFVREWLVPESTENVELLEYLLEKRTEYKNMI
jgi:hypothetical protein